MSAQAGTAPAPVSAPASRGSSGYGFPILLVAIGVYALLVNLGAIAAPRWQDLLTLWPLFLVIGGIDLLVSRRSPLIGIALITAIVTLSLVAVSVGAPAVTPGAQVDRVSVPVDGASAASVNVSFAAGRLVVGGGATTVAQVASDLGNVASTVSRDGGRVRADLRRSEGTLWFPRSNTTEWTVSLNDALAYDLDLDLAAGDFDIDLRSVQVTSMSVNAAAGDLYLVLPKAKGDTRVTIDGAFVSIVIAVPAGTAARVTSDGVLGTFTGGDYGGYANATDRVTVTAKGALASIQVRELP